MAPVASRPQAGWPVPDICKHMTRRAVFYSGVLHGTPASGLFHVAARAGTVLLFIARKLAFLESPRVLPSGMVLLSAILDDTAANILAHVLVWTCVFLSLGWARAEGWICWDAVALHVADQDCFWEWPQLFLSPQQL